MQRNTKGNQIASQPAPSPAVKNKFSCKDCSFACNSLQNFRIHLQTVHKADDDNSQKMSTFVKTPDKKWIAPHIQSGNKKWIAPHIQSEPQKWMAAPNIPSEQQKWMAAPTITSELKKWMAAQSIQSEIQKLSVSPNIQSGQQKWMPVPEFASGIKKLMEIPNIQPVLEKQKWIPASNIQPENQKGIPAPNVQSGIMTGSSGRNIAKLKDYISRVDREPLIGLEYVLEYNLKAKLNQIETRYFCEICEVDTDVDSMVEHLAGFGHRKLYLAKEYPYVLKAQSNSKKDRSQFIRRMALEIEREEGTKQHMTDDSVWMDTMMYLRSADKHDKNRQERSEMGPLAPPHSELKMDLPIKEMKKKSSRWDDNKNDQTRMQKALNFLGTFEIESEIESTTVTRLCEKLTANLKLYHTKSKEQALFPGRVARAKDVAMSLTIHAATQHTQSKKKKNKKKTHTLTENPNLQKIGGGRLAGFPGSNFQNMNVKQNMPMAPPYQQARHPFVPGQVPSMLKINYTPQKAENDDSSVLKNISQEDSQFFKKLMSLLEALPQRAPPSETSPMDSKLLMLKSLLGNQKSAEHEHANQKLMTQIASMVQNTISAQNANLNQQLMMLMSSQNSSAMGMQTASLRNNVMGTDGSISGTGLVPGIQSAGTMQSTVNSLRPFSQTYGKRAGNAFGPMNPNAYKGPQDEMQTYPGTSQNYPSTSQNYPSTSQNYDNFGYGNSMAGKYLPQGNPYVSQHDGVNTLSAGQNKEKLIPYTDVGYGSSVGDKKWDNSSYGKPSAQVSEPRYVDNSRGEIRKQDPKQQPSLRFYNSSDRNEGDMPYLKRPRLDMGERSDESLESLGINTAGLPEALLQRIQGKDLFTASAIISEYSYSGK